jgi:2-polyprenyl-6-methoxyphenol hydroxylase-like FAD-dependent oxidoreductase
MSHQGKIEGHKIESVEQTTCCIVGGGPAGAVLAYMLARKGIEVTLLEAHMDFEREFRGDTIHASVMEIMEELGLAERLLQIRHTEARKLTVDTANGKITVADLTHLKTKYPYITIMAQSKFLDFITSEARRYPNFHMIMGAQVDELIEENGAVQGVRYRGQDGWYELRAPLTVGADGRFSRLRRLSGFEPIKTSPPMDILWFRLSRKDTDAREGLAGRIGKRVIVVLIDRFDYWQVGYVIPKGSYQQMRAAGIEQLRQQFAKTVPDFADRIEELKEWKQISVLSVESDRLPRWYRPGLLLIGDAAHVMSPVGGVGINYAIQDAIVAANILSGKLKYGIVETYALAQVQRQRELPTRLLQAFQTFMQKKIFTQVINSPQALRIPLQLRLFLRLPLVRNLPASFIAFGPFPVHVKKE